MIFSSIELRARVLASWAGSLVAYRVNPLTFGRVPSVSSLDVGALSALSSVLIDPLSRVSLWSLISSNPIIMTLLSIGWLIVESS